LTECLLYDVDRVPPGFHSPFRQIVAILERPADTVRLLCQSGVPEEQILMLQLSASPVSEPSTERA